MTRSPHSVRIAGFAAIPAALVIAGAVVGGASYSAFNATATTPSSNWTAGTVALASDSQNSALFTASNLAPGATGKKDITVTSTGSLASVVKLYGTSAATTGGLASAIDLKIVEGTGTGAAFAPLATGSAVYTGTLADFGASYSNYSNGLSTWTTAGGSTAEARTFEISYTLDPNVSNTAQGGTASLGFTWEAQNK